MNIVISADMDGVFVVACLACEEELYYEDANSRTGKTIHEIVETAMDHVCEGEGQRVEDVDP